MFRSQGKYGGRTTVGGRTERAYGLEQNTRGTIRDFWEKANRGGIKSTRHQGRRRHRPRRAAARPVL